MKMKYSIAALALLAARFVSASSLQTIPTCAVSISYLLKDPLPLKHYDPNMDSSNLQQRPASPPRAVEALISPAFAAIPNS